jgi:uncharacterized membrane protein YphA (DoxX/SURF4 family)
MLGSIFLWAAVSKMLWMNDVSYGQTFVGSLLGGRRGWVVLASVVEGSAGLALLIRVGVGRACVLLCAGLLTVGLLYVVHGDHAQVCGCMGSEGSEHVFPLSVPVRVGVISVALITLGARERMCRIAARAPVARTLT